MFATPNRPSADALRGYGWQMREWHAGHGAALCATEVTGGARWTSHFEDLVLTRCLQTVQARFDFGENRNWQRLAPQDFVLLPARTAIDAHIQQPHASVHCALPLSLIEAHASAGLTLDDLRILFRRPFQSPVASMLTGELWQEARAGHPGGRLFGEAAASLLAFALARAAGKSPVVHKGGLTPRQMATATDRIEASLAEGVSLHVLAADAGLSVWHFSRAFHVSAGVTVTEFVQRRRIAAAQRLLATGRASILDAAMAVGFSSPSHFAKLFRRYTGQSPRDWMRSLR